MADHRSSMPFILAIFVLYIFQIRLLNAEKNSTENGECKVVGDVSLDGWSTETDKGVVFVCFNNSGTFEWGVICTDQNWDDVAAKVVCRQLGYGGSSKAVKNAQHEFLSFSAVFKDVAMDSVKCIGNEMRLVDCKHGSICSSFFSLAGVKCNYKGNDGNGGFSNDFEDDQFDQYSNTWDSGGNVTPRITKKLPTFILYGVIAVVAFTITGIIRARCQKQQQARRRNNIPNTTVENFQMVPPNHPSNYQTGQHPPPGSAFPNPHQVYPPKSQTGEIRPPSYPSSYPTGAHQYPPSVGMIPPFQPNPYQTGEPQYRPSPGVVSPSQPNPYPSGVQPLPSTAKMTSPPTPFIPSNEYTELPNCPPPSYDDTFTIRQSIRE